MTSTFSVDAARALGRARLARRAPAAAPPPSASPTISWPTAEEEIWRYSRIGELDLDRYRPFDAERARRAGRRTRRRAAARGPPKPARTRACRRARRPGRPPRARRPRSRPRACACAASRPASDDDVRAAARRGARDSSEDAFTVLHDAFLAGGAFVQVPAGVVVEDPILVLHWCEGDGRASFPHTLRVARRARRGDRARPLRLARDRPPRRRGHRAARRRQRAPPLPLDPGARQPHVAPRPAARASSAATRRSRPSAVALGGDYARLRSESLLARRGRRERPARRVLRRRLADARLPHAPGPRRAPHAQRPAVQGRGRGRRPLGVLRPRPPPRRPRRRRTRPRRTATSCSPRARARSRSRTSRSRPTTCSARTRRRSARSTTTSSTTSRAAASRPTTPSGSSCSASSTTCSSGCR